MAENVPSTQSH